MAIELTDLKLPEFTYEMHLCLMGTKPSHVSQNFFKFSILPGVLGRSVFKTRPCPVVAILATSSQFTVFLAAILAQFVVAAQSKFQPLGSA